MSRAPQDVAAISDAQLIFINGLELEHSMDAVIQANAGGAGGGGLRWN